ncbi:hypothetical protein CRE_06528 [Caenorhabditis remanei]|uniref:Uncharacterized protein n=1 Tax=Caenorhabditis remanei TaxID=31234 RepID=E3M1F1_CAERE|nr:hypothetical protein CRE_06528 [Caenorhabditis remanei]
MMNSTFAQMNPAREVYAQENQYQALWNAFMVLAGDHVNLNDRLQQALKENRELKKANWNLKPEDHATQHDVETMEESIHFMSKRMDLQDETIKDLQSQLAAQQTKENKLIDENLQLNENLENSVAQNATLREEVLALHKNDMINDKTAANLHKLMSEAVQTLSASRIECGYQPLDGEKKTLTRQPRKTDHKKLESEETPKVTTRSRQSTSDASGPANKRRKM